MTIVDTYTTEISWENLNVIQKKKKKKVNVWVMHVLIKGGNPFTIYMLEIKKLKFWVGIKIEKTSYIITYVIMVFIFKI